MLFNSYEFLPLFLLAALFGFFDLETRVRRFYRDKQGGKAILQAAPLLIFASYRLTEPPRSYLGAEPGS